MPLWKYRMARMARVVAALMLPVCLFCWDLCSSLFFLASRLVAGGCLLPCEMILHLLTPLLRSGLCIGALESGSENGGPSCPIVSTSDSSPNGSTQEGALQTFLQRRKNGSSSLVPRPAPYWLWHSKPSRCFALKSACGGSPTKRRATRTVLAKQRSCWSGGHSNQSLPSL